MSERQGGVQLAEQLYRTMRTIRTFEEDVAEAVRLARAPGFVHLSTGQEAIAAGVCAQLRRDDRITSSHRPIGHGIAKGMALGPLMAELYGRATGCCGGKGGSMSIADPAVGMLGSNGIVGASIPTAVGAALASQVQGTGSVAACFFGEGATARGEFAESLNLAAIWSLPLVFVCENNGFTEFTPAAEIAAGEIATRGDSYGVACRAVDATDVWNVLDAAGEAVERARRGDGPTLLECHAWRLAGHEEGEEAYIGYWAYRTEEEWEAARASDPLLRLRAELDEQTAARIDDEVAAAVQEAVEHAVAAPWPDATAALEDVYA